MVPGAAPDVEDTALRIGARTVDDFADFVFVFHVVKHEVVVYVGIEIVVDFVAGLEEEGVLLGKGFDGGGGGVEGCGSGGEGVGGCEEDGTEKGDPKDDFCPCGPGGIGLYDGIHPVYDKLFIDN